MSPIRWLGALLGFAGGGLWTTVGLACSRADGPLACLLHALVPGGLLLLSTAVALREPFLGGLLLLAAAVGFAWFFTPRPLILGLVVLPPLLAGLAFLVTSQPRPGTVG